MISIDTIQTKSLEYTPSGSKITELVVSAEHEGVTRSMRVKVVGDDLDKHRHALERDLKINYPEVFPLPEPVDLEEFDEPDTKMEVK